MASQLRSVETRDVINVSQGARSSPAAPSARSSQRQRQSKVLVQDSLEAESKAAPAHHEIPTAPGANEEEDDLYGVSPRTQARTQAIRSSNTVNGGRDRAATGIGTGSLSTKQSSTSRVVPSSSRAQESQPADAAFAVPLHANERTTSNLKSVAQAALSQQGRDRTTPASTGSSKADAGLYTKTPRNPSAESRTSNMVSAAKEAASLKAATHTSTQGSAAAALRAKRRKSQQPESVPAKKTAEAVATGDAPQKTNAGRASADEPLRQSTVATRVPPAGNQKSLGKVAAQSRTESDQPHADTLPSLKNSMKTNSQVGGAAPLADIRPECAAGKSSLTNPAYDNATPRVGTPRARGGPLMTDVSRSAAVVEGDRNVEPAQAQVRTTPERRAKRDAAARAAAVEDEDEDDIELDESSDELEDDAYGPSAKRAKTKQNTLKKPKVNPSTKAPGQSKRAVGRQPVVPSVKATKPGSALAPRETGGKKTPLGSIYDILASPDEAPKHQYFKKTGKKKQMPAKIKQSMPTAASSRSMRRKAPKRPNADTEYVGNSSSKQLINTAHQAQSSESSPPKGVLTAEKPVAKKRQSQGTSSKEIEAQHELQQLQDKADPPLRDSRSPVAKSEAAKPAKSGVEKTSKPARQDRLRQGPSRAALTVPGATPSGTQDEPVELSSDKKSSLALSDIGDDGGRDAGPVPQTEQRPNMYPSQPRTPTGMRSSPPVRPQQEPNAQPEVRPATNQCRKANVIAFDQTGPRNQGSLGGRTPVESTRSSVPPSKGPPVASAKAKLNLKRETRALSVGTATASRHNTARPGGIGPSVEHCLADLKAPSKPKFTISPNAKHAASPASGLADNGDDAQHNEGQSHEHIGALPPMEDAEGASLVGEAVPESTIPPRKRPKLTVSQQAMPPPKKMAKSPQGRAPVVPAMRKDPFHRQSDQADESRAKRSRTPEQSTERPAKRVKPDESQHTRSKAAAEHSPLSKRKSNANSHAALRSSKPSKGPESIDAVLDSDHQTESHHRDTLSMQRKKPSTLTEPISRPVLATRRPQQQGANAFQRSQSLSQRVDIGGSPVPDNMEVCEGITVLETFSRTANISSGRTNAAQFTKDRQRFSDTPEENEFSPPPSHQPQRPITNNTKQRAASPQAKTQLVTKRLGDEEIQHLFEDEDALLRMKDPFTKTRQTSIDEPQAAASSPQDAVMDFDQLRPDRRSNNISTESSPPRAVLETYTQRPSHITMAANTYIVPTKRHDGNTKPLQDVSRTARDGARSEHVEGQVDQEDRNFSRGAEEEEDLDMEDPDQTLVDEEEIAQPTQRLPSMSQKARETSKHDTEYEPLSDDLMAWCKTLKPHQLNLFDELVKIAQKLSSYFVEQENSIERQLAKQHQNGLYMIEQEELLRAKQYDRLNVELQRAKREMRKELKRCEKDLQEIENGYEREKQARAVRKAERDASRRELEEFIRSIS